MTTLPSSLTPDPTPQFSVVDSGFGDMLHGGEGGRRLVSGEIVNGSLCFSMRYVTRVCFYQVFMRLSTSSKSLLPLVLPLLLLSLLASWFCSVLHLRQDGSSALAGTRELPFKKLGFDLSAKKLGPGPSDPLRFAIFRSVYLCKNACLQLDCGTLQLGRSSQGSVNLSLVGCRQTLKLLLQA